jgi:hypothetical protein
MIHRSVISNKMKGTTSDSFFDTGIEGTPYLEIILEVVGLVTGTTNKGFYCLVVHSEYGFLLSWEL